MNNPACLYCGRPEPCRHYHPPAHTDFVCSRCVQKLIACSASELEQLFNRHYAKGCKNKTRALGIFLTSEMRKRLQNPAGYSKKTSDLKLTYW